MASPKSADSDLRTYQVALTLMQSLNFETALFRKLSYCLPSQTVAILIRPVLATGLHSRIQSILLCHYYNKVLKDKNKEKNGDGPVPLRLEELMYDEAFTLTHVSLSILLPVCINPQSIQSTELYGFGNEVRLFLILY